MIGNNPEAYAVLRLVLSESEDFVGPDSLNIDRAISPIHIVEQDD